MILARQEKGESLWQLGRRDEAIEVWTDAVQRNLPKNMRIYSLLRPLTRDEKLHDVAVAPATGCCADWNIRWG